MYFLEFKNNIADEVLKYALGIWNRESLCSRDCHGKCTVLVVHMMHRSKKWGPVLGLRPWSSACRHLESLKSEDSLKRGEKKQQRCSLSVGVPPSSDPRLELTHAG